MFRTAFCLTALFCAVQTTLADTPRPDTARIDAARIDAARQKGISFLKVTQSADGSWTSPTQPGISGLVVYSLIANGVPLNDPTVAQGLKHLESFSQPDGGFYSPNTAHKNYETSIIVLALTAADKAHLKFAAGQGGAAEAPYTARIQKAVEFLKGIQWDDADGAPRNSEAFGGQGYGRHKRPDLSNTAFFLEALHEAGVSPDDEAFKNALVFVSRCQNLKSENNELPFADKINDGGFYYTAAAGGASMAGGTPEEGLRSYASMTYAGLKSMIYAGLTQDDPRVKAASTWIAKHYTFEENPGMGQSGLFYYFHTASKTLDTLKSDTFKDEKGVSHHWRVELSDRILSLQKSNGSWLNDAERWYEGDPHIVTAYALLSLQFCSPAKEER